MFVMFHLVTSRWRYREVVEMLGSETLWEKVGHWERALEGCIILVFLDPSSVCIPSLIPSLILSLMK